MNTVVLHGLRYASRLSLMLPLYLSALVLGLIQLWPLGNFDALHNPLLGVLSEHGLDALVELGVGAPTAFGSASVAWSAGAGGLALIFGLLYSLFSGGILSAWHGTRTLWSGSWHFFAGSIGLGMLLWVLLLVAIGIGIAAGFAFGVTVGAIVAFSLIQLVNLIGEYARALAIVHDQRNPLVAFGRACGFITRNAPGTLALGLIGLGLHAGIAFAYTSVAGRLTATPITILVEQGVVLAWLWIKLLRLAWALRYAEGESKPNSTPGAVANVVTI